MNMQDFSTPDIQQPAAGIRRHSFRIAASAAAALLVAGLAVPAFATTYYVDGSVASSGNGTTPQTAVKAIAKGLAMATTYVWTGAGEDDNWTTSENWEPATGYPSATDDTALFTNGTIAAICFDESVTFGTLNVSNKNMRLTFTGGDGVTATCTTLMAGTTGQSASDRSETTFDGLSLKVKTTAVTPNPGQILRLENGTSLSVTKLTFSPASFVLPEARVEVRSGSTLASSGDIELTGASVLLVSNATVTCKGGFYIDNKVNGVAGYGRLVFQGRHPVLRVTGANFATKGKSYVYAPGGDIDFLVPEGGYEEVPIQYTGSGVFLKTTNTSTSPTRFNILFDSPAILSREELSQTLVSLNTKMTSASLVGFPELPDPAAQTIGKSADDLSIVFTQAASTGLVSVTASPWPLPGGDYSSVTGLAAGESRTLTAPAIPADAVGVSCAGCRIYDIDPATGARTEIEDSPFAGTTVAYTHGGARREVEWIWSLPEVNVPAGSTGEDLQAALDAHPYARVNAATGDYTRASASFYVTNAIVLTGGSDDPALTKMRVSTASGRINAVVVSHPLAIVRKVLVSNNNSTADGSNAGLRIMDGLVEDCVVTNCSGATSGGTREDGCGVRMTGGVLRRTTVTKCERARYAGAGIALCGGLVDSCSVVNCEILTGYAANGGGIWVSQGAIRNTLVANCQATDNGFGIYAVPTANTTNTISIENCTIANCGTVSSSAGFGLYASGMVTIRNTIVRDNANTVADANVSATSAVLFEHCDTSPARSALYGNFDADPSFTDATALDYTIGMSPCVDGGVSLAWHAGATDLGGNPRVQGAAVDVGCYEREAVAALDCSFTMAGDGAADLSSVTLDALVSGASGDVTYVWTALDEFGNVAASRSGTGLSSVTIPLGPGLYTFRLEVSAGLETASSEQAAALRIYATTAYANASGASIPPYATLANGGTNLLDVVAAVAHGGTVYVADGTYEIDDWLFLGSGRGIAVVSLNGPARTIVKPRHVSAFGYDMHRSMYYLASSGARLEGLTLLGSGSGADRPSADAFECYSPTLYIDNAAAVVSNCVVRDCWGAERKVSGLGVRLVSGTLVDSAVMNCRIGIATSGTCPGVGIYNEGGLVDRCVVSNVWTTGTAENATNGVAIHQTAGDTRNTLVADTCGTCYPAVAVKDGHFDNCTVTANSNCLTSATGLHTAGLFALGSAAVRNCVIAHNFSASAGVGEANVLKTGSAAFSHCLVSTLDFTGGDHCIFADPCFRDFDGGDYTFRSSSPLRDAGVILPWMEGALDLAGGKRLVGKPDIGCYESQAPYATVIQLW